jgi:hypothetical protein
VTVIPSPTELLVFALSGGDSEQFLIVEGSTPAHRGSDTLKVQGPMREEKLRMVLADRFGMTLEAITRSVEQARQHLRERGTEAPLTFPSHPHEQPEVAFVERRNHPSRAARVKRLFDRIAATVDGITLTELMEELPRAAAERILKSLAVRGLVKNVEGRWAPRECLKAGVSLPLIPE